MPPQPDPLQTLRTVFPRQLPAPAARVMNILHQLRHFERLAPEEQDKLLSAQLNHLLEHARQRSEFWGERLAKRTRKRQRLQDMLNEVQPLTRKELQTEFERLRAHFPERERMHVTESSTSGSTGTPVRFERAQMLYTPTYQALALVSTQWHGIDQRKALGVIGNRCSDKDRAPLGQPFRWLGPVGVGFERCTKGREIDEIYDYCAERKPAYLQCGPTQLTALARYAIENKRQDLRPEIALTLGSLVTDEIREIVMEGLGTKIVDRYSSEETGYIALQCPKHNHFHVVSAVTHVEIVDDDNKPCPIGTPGRVLLTTSQSYAMPLVRYEIGDMAEWGEPCDCGITLPVIKRLWGRTRHLITTPDGKRTYARIYARDFEDIEGLLAYRFVLHQNQVVVAQLKVKEQSTALAAAVTEKVQRALSYPFPVQIRYVDQIDWGSTWKQDYFGVSDEPPV